MKTNMNIDVSTLSEVICSSCGGKYWEQVFLLKKVSALISPNGQEGVINVPVLVCISCKQNIQDNLEDDNANLRIQM